MQSKSKLAFAQWRETKNKDLQQWLHTRHLIKNCKENVLSAALPAIIESFGGIENILIRLTQNANQNQLKSMDEIIQNEKIKYDQQILQENTDDKLLNEFLEDNPSDLQLTKPEICNLSVCTFKVLYVTSVFRYLCLMF